MTDRDLPEYALTEVQLAVLGENTALAMRNGLMGLYIARLHAQSRMYETLLELGVKNNTEAEYYRWAAAHAIVAAEVELPLVFASATHGLRTIFGAKRIEPAHNTTLQFSEVFIGQRQAGDFQPTARAEHGFSLEHVMFTLGRISIQNGAGLAYGLSGKDWPDDVT
jgi:hypothetical protein